MKNEFCNYCDCDITDYESFEKKEKTQISNSVKVYLIDSGLYDSWRNYQKALYFESLSRETGSYNNPYQKYLSIDLNLSPFQNICCRQLFNARRSRVLRLKKKLKFVLQHYDCLFLTLTFTDKVLNTTCEKTRRTYISRYLKSLNCPFYVANIDYGDKEKNPSSKEREHYHAVVQVSKIDLKSYKYGFIFVESVRYSMDAVPRISNYVNKLSYHAYKDSTGQCRLIYSKNQVKNNSIVKLDYSTNQFYFKNI